MKHRTTLIAKAEIIKPKSDEFKTIAASLQDRYGFDLKPQMDLLYARSCLVSAGSSVGVNDNDDIFTREEAWAARHTPVLKPFNWQHQDKDILGVIYTVQACDLDGNVLDITDETPPDCDFDLWVEAAIFRLIHEERAAEIEARAKAGSLYVSMEAWFDDYSYGFFDKDNGLQKTVSRNQNTSFLDKCLRANRGAGVYRDPDSDQDMRIGRVLRSITFGGCGFVDRPANKRSKIDTVESMNSSAERDTESQIELLLQKVLESQNNTEELVMNHTQGSQGPGPEDIGAAVGAELDRREQAQAARDEQEKLLARASDAEERAAELQARVDELTQAQEARDAEVEALNTQLEEYGAAVEELIQDQAAAGATDSTPAEIATIDAAQGGDEAWAAKIAWISRSMASLRERAARADELENQLAEAEAVVREQEVRNLFDGTMSEEAIETFVSHASGLDEEEYARWRDEKELMLLEIAQAADKKEMPEQFKKKNGKNGKNGDEKGCASENPFTALLARLRSESGTADPDTMRNNPNEPDLINHPGDGSTDVRSGVNSGTLKTPRHKIAGSAGDDPAEALEDVQEDGGVSLAGAQTGDDGEEVSPFRTIAELVTKREEESEEDETQDRPGFDPVQ